MTASMETRDPLQILCNGIRIAMDKGAVGGGGTDVDVGGAPSDP